MNDKCDYCGEEAVIEVEGISTCDVCKDMADSEIRWARVCLLIDR